MKTARYVLILLILALFTANAQVMCVNKRGKKFRLSNKCRKSERIYNPSEDLEDRLEDVEESEEQNKKRLEQLEKQEKQLEQSVGLLKQQEEELENKVTTLQQEEQALEKKVTEAEKKVTEAETKAKEAETKVTTLEPVVYETESEVGEVKEEVEEITKKTMLERLNGTWDMEIYLMVDNNTHSTTITFNVTEDSCTFTTEDYMFTHVRNGFGISAGTWTGNCSSKGRYLLLSDVRDPNGTLLGDLIGFSGIVLPMQVMFDTDRVSIDYRQNSILGTLTRPSS